MERRELERRENWQQIAEKFGFYFHHALGQIYWDESACYEFTLAEIENNLESPGQDIYEMCLALVEEVVNDEILLNRLQIPKIWHELIRESWQNRDQGIYGRFDFAYNGNGPAKLLEFNADTPTSLYESAFFQWQWLEDCFPYLDQFNSIQENLTAALGKFAHLPLMHFASVKGSEEDRATVEYIMDCALQAGVAVRFVFMEDIGVTATGQLVDDWNEPIRTLFKLYPWEFIWDDVYGCNVRLQYAKGLRLIEPAWKMVLANKGILPLLWQRYRNHPNLLPAGFMDEELPEAYVIKPMLGREGANISIVKNNITQEATGGIYGSANIWQAFEPLPNFSGNYPVCGVWIANNQCCGLGIREDKSRITGDLSRFVPHIIK